MALARVRRKGGGRRFRIGMRGVCAGVALVAFVLSLLGFWLAWNEYRTAARLGDHGAHADARFLRVATVTSTDSDSRRSRSSTYHYGIWAYRVDGRDYELQDRGVRAGSDQPQVPIPEPGTVLRDHIVYLPEKPSTARLRREADADLTAPLGFGAFFLLFALVFGAVGRFLLKPRRGLG